MQKKLLGLFIAGSLYACNSSTEKSTTTEDSTKLTVMGSNTISEQEKTDGWQLLFDGQTARGWHKYGGAPVGAAWKVADSSIHLEASEKKRLADIEWR